METSKEPIGVRITRLNNRLISQCKSSRDSSRLISREGVLDALNVLYDECNNETLKRDDRNIAEFVDRFRACVAELRRLRVNISDFEVKSVIGRGHFGEVHVVREKQTGDVYALKTLRKADTLSGRSISFYEEERDVMAAATSPWLTSLQYAFQDRAHLYLVMEFHPGGDLSGLLERHGGTLSESSTKFYLAELASALRALHLMGYVHRDVKPDNVLLDRCGHLKLADFGSSAKLSGDGRVTSRMPVGTPEYVAPEVLASIESVGAYGTECDYWSLGIVAYELVFGCTPFSGAALTAVYDNIMNFSSSLEFPGDVAASGAFRSLVSGLLTSADVRFGHGELLGHAFFDSVDWNCLRDRVPPFVPRVASVDDTSNFVEFERRARAPNVDNLKTKLRFSGRNLPFVGFTFARDARPAPTMRDVDEPPTRPLSAEKTFVSDAPSVPESALKEVEVLKRRLSEQIRQMKLSESSRDKLEKRLALGANEIAHLRRTIEAERLERKELETKALELIKAAKRKWEAAEAERTLELNARHDDDTQRITELCTRNNELTGRLARTETELSAALLELERLRDECAERKSKMAEARALNRRSVAGVESRLEKIASETHERLESETKLRASLEARLRDLVDAESKLKRDAEEREREIETLRASLRRAADECRDVESLRRRLEATDRERSEACGASETAIADLRSALAGEREASSRLRDEVATLREELDAAGARALSDGAASRALASRHESEILSLTERLGRVTSDRDDVLGRLRDVEESDRLNRSKVADLEELVERLERGVAKLEAAESQEDRVVRLEGRLAAAHESLALEKQAASAAKSALWKKEKELADCRLDKRIVERELKCAEDGAKALAAEIERAERRSDAERARHDESVAALKAQNAELAVAVERSERDALRHDEDAARWRRERAELEETIAESRRFARSLEESNAALEASARERDEAASRSERACEESRAIAAELQRARATICALEAALDERRAELEGARINVTMLREACTTLDGQLEDYEKLVAHHETKRRALETERAESEARVELLRARVGDVERQLNDERASRASVERQRETATEEASMLKRINDNLTSRLAEYKASCASLSEQVADGERRAAELDVCVKSLERRLEIAESEAVLVKEESAHHLTLLHALKRSNAKLAGELDECKDDVSASRARAAELDERLRERLAYYRHRELKSESIRQQQTKLIDYLQTKLEERGKKKKTLTDKIFGSSRKENVVPTAAAPKSRRTTNDPDARLQHEITKNRNVRRAREEIAALGGREAERDVGGGAPAAPEAAAPVREAWMKIADAPNAEWRERYVRLIGSKLALYERRDDALPLSTVDLRPPDATVEIVTDVPAADVVGGDARTVFEIATTPATARRPRTTTYAMAASASAKDDWSKLLRRAAGAAIVVDVDGGAGHDVATVWTREDRRVSVLCALELDRHVLLIGTGDGVRSVVDGSARASIGGVTHVAQIGASRRAGVVVMIAGETRRLVSCDLRLVESVARAAACSAPALSVRLIADERFGSFALSDADTMCAATSEKIVVMRYDLERRNYFPVRMLDTARPCACALFREHSLLVGANKFFEVDLRDFSAEEFLDASDDTLSHVVRCHEFGAFPRAVAAVRGDEYLLCFDGFGVFVDGFGTRSRERDVEWTTPPAAFACRGDRLFVVGLDGVETIDVGPESDERRDRAVTRLAGGCTFVGASDSRPAIYVLHGDDVKSIRPKRGADDDDGDEDDGGDCEDDDDEAEFSFTGSMLESLDRDDTSSRCDGDSRASSDDADRTKRVRFGAESETAM